MSLVKDKHIRLTIADGVDTAVALSQTASTSYVLNGTLAVGGVVTFDVPRHVKVTASGNETSNSWTIVGTNRQGEALTETATGLNGSTATTLRNFKTITSITQTATNAGNVWFGSADTLETAWIPLDHRTPHMSSVAVDVVSGTITFQVDKTYDDPTTFTESMVPSTVYATTLIASGTVDVSTTIGDFTPTAIKLLITALGSAAVLNLHITQA